MEFFSNILLKKFGESDPQSKDFEMQKNYAFFTKLIHHAHSQLSKNTHMHTKFLIEVLSKFIDLMVPQQSYKGQGFEGMKLI